MRTRPRSVDYRADWRGAANTDRWWLRHGFWPRRLHRNGSARDRSVETPRRRHRWWPGATR